MTLFDKIWDKHVVKQIEGGPSVFYIDRHFIHEVTSPQAFDGLRKRGIPVGAACTNHRNSRPQCADLGSAFADQGSPVAPASGKIDRKLQGFRRGIVRTRPPLPGHRACDRAGTGHYPAGHDHRLRRQPHEHTRRFRRHCVRDRNERSGNGFCYPMPDAKQTQTDAHQRRRVNWAKA